MQAADGIPLQAIKDAFKQLQVLQQISVADLVARLDAADPLAAEAAALETSNSAASTSDGRYACCVCRCIIRVAMEHMLATVLPAACEPSVHKPLSVGNGL